jgi:hypothetical protein
MRKEIKESKEANESKDAKEHHSITGAAPLRGTATDFKRGAAEPRPRVHVVPDQLCGLRMYTRTAMNPQRRAPASIVAEPTTQV